MLYGMGKEIELARRYGILGKCIKLETELLKIPGVTKVEFDLQHFDCGLPGNYRELIFLTKYNIPPYLPGCGYFERERQLKAEVLRAALENDLSKTADRIEDYGEHFYWVFAAGESWKTKSRDQTPEPDGE